MLSKLKKISSAILCLSMAFCTMPQAYGSSIIYTDEINESVGIEEETKETYNADSITEKTENSEESENSSWGGAK